ncbi:MAG: hypothetical protein MZV65_33900 [Chromatiales bacterium]|nr:hypothetical protein [Chromatiales bacterium]
MTDATSLSFARSGCRSSARRAGAAATGERHAPPRHAGSALVVSVADAAS